MNKSGNVQKYFIFIYFTIFRHPDEHYGAFTASDILRKMYSIKIFYLGKSPRALWLNWPIPSPLSHWPVYHCISQYLAQNSKKLSGKPKYIHGLYYNKRQCEYAEVLYVLHTMKTLTYTCQQCHQPRAH